MDTTQYLDMFIDESTEHLDTLYQQLLALEDNPTDKKIIEEIFRAAHTLKGMAATMEFSDLAHLTHVLENIFDGIRYDRITVTADMMDHLLHTVDLLNEMVENIAGGGDGKRDITDITEILNAIENGDQQQVVEEKEVNPLNNHNASANTLQLDEFQLAILSESIDKGLQNFTISVHLTEECLLKAARVFMVFSLLEDMGEIIYATPSVQELEEEKFDRSFQVLFVSKQSQSEIEAKLLKVSEVENIQIAPFLIDAYKEKGHTEEGIGEEKKTSKKEKKEVTVKQTSSKTIRVNIERLDVLMNLFEELVIDKGQLEQISLELQHSELQETVERMSRVSSDLQNIILTMRMVPIDTVFSRFPRMIRQLARDLHKEVAIEVVGEDTELDRTVIDEIGDPLVHLIRNAMDHGIETPEVRIKNNKPEQGTIKLVAYHSGNHVFVEISDDGAGIHVDKVKGKAIEKGVITPEEAEVLTDQEAFELIMASGFSTNDKISDVSGRGVGLDVVKNTIESLGGQISIDSVIGEGSTFTIQLPLTLSIISVLLVELQEEKYAIPLSSIIETAVLPKSDIYHAYKNQVIDFRGNVIPLVDLKQIFEVPHVEQDESDYVSVVIVRKGNKMTGFIVDSFIGQQEIVLKSLGDYLANVFAISGATILGNGEVSLIIDSNALIK